MELSSEDHLPMALDLSKRCEKSPRVPRTTGVLDLVTKPGWPSVTDEHHVSLPCMQILSEKTLSDTGVRLSNGNRSCVHSPLLHNGMNRSLRDSRLYELNRTESPNAESPISESMDGDTSQSDSDSVILLLSSSKEAQSPQIYINKGSFSPLVKPLSPGAVSMDDAKDCFLLPQTMGSPCTDNTYSEDSSDSTEEMSVNTKPVLSLAELAAAYGQSVRSTVDMSSDDSDVIEVPITNENKSISSFLVGHQEEERLTGESSNTVEKSPSPQPRILRPIVTAQRPLSNVICHNSKIHDKNISRILQKCNSGNAADSKERSCSSEDESWLQPTVHLYRCVVDSDDSDVGHSAVRLKPSQSLGSSRTPRSPLATESRPKSSYRKNVHQESTVHSSLSTQGSRTKPKPPQRSPVKEPRALSSSKAAASKTKNVKRQRKKKQKNVGSSSLFAPQEPEIKLKYANFKHDKRDSRSEDFSPFVHIEQREYLACTVVNYQQEVNDVRENQKQQKLPTGAVSLSGVVPKTSCYRLGRLSSRSKCQPLMMCSLCGGCANAVGLGDLHGPYYPNEPAVQEHCKQQAQKEDQIASEPSVDSKTGLCAQVEENGLRGPCNGPEIDTVDEDCCIIVSDCESSPLPSAKKFRTNGVADSHSPPSVPHNTNERWIHEDCGIWSTDVFLVKGKLYGLEEAVSLAQETVCSTCHATGATMGCIQKGCPNKYHYTCALESGCVLNEENFSMRCPTHKNKTFKGVYMTNTR